MLSVVWSRGRVVTRPTERRSAVRAGATVCNPANGGAIPSVLILYGPVAKRLGKGLQNPLQRFDSAPDLKLSLESVKV